jgi:glycosyltransferase involved in cell wall biosynthesis
MYNEEDYIEACLNSLLNQDYPKDRYEVLVVDGESTDASPNIVKKLSLLNPQIRHIINTKRITSSALNLGIQESKGEIIVRMDSHALAPANYISICVRHLKAFKADNIGGIIKTLGKGFWGQNISLATSCPFGIGNSKFRYSQDDGFDEAGWPGAFWKETLQDLGGFDESLGCNEDDDLNFRLVKSGRRVFRTPEIELTYFGRGSLYKLWIQYYRYGYWKIKVIQKFGKLTSIRHLIPSIFVSSLIILSLLSVLFDPFSYIVGIILGVYFIISIIYAIKISMKSGLKYFFSLPVIFPILHLSYGIGFILGAIRFAFKNNK